MLQHVSMTEPGQFKDFPYDPELTDNEAQQVDLAILGQKVSGGQQLDKGSALNLQSSFLLRKRLNVLSLQIESLNRSSKRLETVTWLLVATSVFLLLVSALRR